MAAAVPTAEFVLESQGDVWNVRFGRNSGMVKDSKGIAMLAKLISQPDREMHVLDLSGASGVVDSGDAGPMLDEQARSDYRARVAELQEELNMGPGGQ